MRPSAVLALKVYACATAAAALPAAWYLKYKRRRDPPYGKDFRQLLGLGLPRSRGCVWFHAASMGEAIALKPLLRAFVKARPDLPVIFTSLTTTGRGAIAGMEGVTALFAPLDSPCVLRRFFRALHPRALFLIDTELWPCMLEAARRHHCPVCLVNARMQESSCRSYEKFPVLSAGLLASKLHSVLCISEEDAARFRRIGVPEHALCVSGSLKYDLTPNTALFEAARAERQQYLGEAPVFCAASFHDEEIPQVLEACRLLRRRLEGVNLILVPRHAGGAQKCAQQLAGLGLNFMRRSSAAGAPFRGGVLLGDTMGEMEYFLGLSSVVFLGGSFNDTGGHNPLEPAYFALPCLTGPCYHNFQEQFEALLQTGGAFLTRNAQELAEKAAVLLTNPARAAAAGAQAQEVQRRGRGALQLTLQKINGILSEISFK